MAPSFRTAALAVICLLITGYFAHHSKSGRYGFETRAKLEARLATAQSRIRGLERARHRLRSDIALLGATPPNRDRVETLAQAMLGYAYDADQIWLTTRQAQPEALR
ncbi:MAG: hypothetical protein AAFR60_00220 [Pseudomonadota bacterium]